MTRTTYSARLRNGSRAKITFSAVLIAAVASILLLAPPQHGTAALTASTTTSGGATAPSAPIVRDAICSTGCVALRRAAIGGTLQVTGRNLSLVTQAIYRGREGRIAVPVRSVTETSATVPVPAGARPGPIRLRDDFGSISEPSPRIAIVARRALQSSGPLQLVSAEATPRRAFFFGVRRPRLSYVVAGAGQATNLRIDVIRSNGEIIQSFFRNAVPHNSVQTLQWNGRGSSGRPAPGGGYSFRVSAQSGERARSSQTLSRTAGGGNPLAFRMLPFTFPVRSRVTWGDGLGAGRNHQGQDLMASCGTPVLAARGGTVVYRGDMEGAAGNYVVISGRAAPYDFVYMHLLRPVRFRVGDTVRTGQVIGLVGSTGRSSACHLHYEMWSAPGWYKGGSPVNPTPLLGRWYRW